MLFFPCVLLYPLLFYVSLLAYVHLRPSMSIYVHLFDCTSSTAHLRLKEKMKLEAENNVMGARVDEYMKLEMELDG